LAVNIYIFQAEAEVKEIKKLLKKNVEEAENYALLRYVDEATSLKVGRTLSLMRDCALA